MREKGDNSFEILPWEQKTHISLLQEMAKRSLVISNEGRRGWESRAERASLANVNPPLRSEGEGDAAVFAITHANVHRTSRQWRVMRSE